MKHIIVLFGKPGAGKGTRVSEFLKGREERYEVLSLGNLLRKEIKEETELGMQAQIYMDAGELMPDEIINKIAINAIRGTDKSVILDGYPRTMPQLKAMCEAKIYPTIVINLDVSDSIILKRAKDRIICEGCGESYTTNKFKKPKIQGICDKCGGELVKRKDDEEELVKNRLKDYEEKTYPVLKYIKDSRIEVFTVDNDSKDAGSLFETIMSALY